ncbi:MAG: MauE/DoxX family redox-associated membrane protein, partial [Gemmataceae bacterium]
MRRTPITSLFKSVATVGLPRLVPLCVGVLLLAAAGLKIAARAGAGAPSLDPGPVSSPLVQGLAILWELLLGVWLLSGAHRRFAGYAAIFTFAVFAAVALRLGFENRPSCGCLGVVSVNPWWMFGLDAGVLTALVLFRPPPSPIPFSAAVRANLVHLIAASLILGFVAAAAVVTLRVTGYARGSNRPPSAIQVQLITEAGSFRAGEKKFVRVTAWNRGERPVRIIGSTAACTCVATGDLPVEIAGGGST